MAKFEYDLIEFHVGHTTEYRGQVLNDVGKAGWDVVAILPGRQHHMVYLKRPVAEPRPAAPVIDRSSIRRGPVPKAAMYGEPTEPANVPAVVRFCAAVEGRACIPAYRGKCGRDCGCEVVKPEEPPVRNLLGADIREADCAVGIECRFPNCACKLKVKSVPRNAAGADSLEVDCESGGRAHCTFPKCACKAGGWYRVQAWDSKEPTGYARCDFPGCATPLAGCRKCYPPTVVRR